MTGLKHYLGPFESYGKGALPPTPFREEQPRLDIDNFYYAQEDEVFAAAARDGFGWSVHRPHTIIGYAVGNAMNMGVTLAVYATICRETGRPFVFPGSEMQWNGLTDMTDARLLARHLEWAATTEAARNQAFNVVNGDMFRWSWMWARLADWFGLKPAPYPSRRMPLEQQLADAGPIWDEIAHKHGLAKRNLAEITSAWHTDADLGRPIEVVTDMSKSRKLGFLDYQATDDSFFDLLAGCVPNVSSPDADAIKAFNDEPIDRRQLHVEKHRLVVALQVDVEPIDRVTGTGLTDRDQGAAAIGGHQRQDRVGGVGRLAVEINRV